MKEEKRGEGNAEMQNRKAQFYIISAVIIIFVIIGLAVVTNYVSVKKEPEKFYDVGDILKQGATVVDYAEYKGINVEDQIELYISLFENYTRLNPEEKFNFWIIYGNITNGEVRAINYSTESSGGVGISFGRTVATAGYSVILAKQQVLMAVNPVDNTVNVTMTSGNNTIITKVPVFQDNNFAFVMTTSNGFNDYILTSLETKQQPV